MFGFNRGLSPEIITGGNPGFFLELSVDRPRGNVRKIQNS